MSSSLCCCEYINSKNERSHIVMCCCDCETLDESCDRLLCCKPISPGASTKIWDTVMDRIRVPYCDGNGARSVDIPSVIGASLVPSFLLIASQDFKSALFVFICFPILIFIWFIYFRVKCVVNNLFYAFNISSMLTTLLVFQMYLLHRLEIDFSENVIFMMMVSMTAILVIKVRARQQRQHSKPQENTFPVKAGSSDGFSCTDSYRSIRDIKCYSIWFNCYVDGNNRRFLLYGLVCILLSTLYGAYLIFTTLCVPDVFIEIMSALIPYDCSNIPALTEFGDLLILSTGFLLLFQAIISLLVLMSHGMVELQAWKRTLVTK